MSKIEDADSPRVLVIDPGTPTAKVMRELFANIPASQLETFAATVAANCTTSIALNPFDIQQRKNHASL